MLRLMTQGGHPRLEVCLMVSTTVQILQGRDIMLVVFIFHH